MGSRVDVDLQDIYYIIEGFLTGTTELLHLFQCQRSSPEGYG